MFGEPGPRVFALPPGVDFAAALATGARRRLADRPPETLARVEIVLNTHRAAGAVSEAFEAAGPAVFLPRISTLDRLALDPADQPPPAIGRLERRLTLTRLARAMLARDPSLGPLSAAGGLADTLAGLIDELHAEGVPFAALADAAEGEYAAHWARALEFLGVIGGAWPDHLSALGLTDPEARRALATRALLDRWAAAPPAHPVIGANSTGSTRVTADLLVAIARAPQGALVLPGFDFALDPAGWAAVTEEHPQYGFARLLARLDMTPGDVRPWADAAPRPRARLMAETLRPAPVTHAWRAAAPALAAEAGAATAGLTLIEAPSPRLEAEAIALMMRETLERPGERVALVTPDRVLARRVTAALARWGLVPDDSSGRPLALTPPGLFLRMTADALAAPFDAAALLALLKHPLAAAGDGRGRWLGEVARLEAEALRNRDAAYRMTSVDALGRARASDEAPVVGEALARGLDRLRPWPAERRPLGDWVAAHLAAAEALSGPALWEKEAGAAALAAMQGFIAAAEAYGDAAAAEYPGLLAAALAEAGDVRVEAYAPHPRLKIWGPLEARAQSADLMILGGLNEDVWPAAPAPDPWLSRPMRARVGLPAPERRVGLSAHDFLQAASAERAVLTRALKADGAPTGPSRWLSRLTTLLGGVAPDALAEMRARGAGWLALAATMGAPEADVAAAPRPTPTPPAAARPRRLSVTEIETLIRDPYSVYAKHVLGLRKLEEPGAAPDARLRGEVLHKVMEELVKATTPDWPGPAEGAALYDRLADKVIADYAPPPRLALIWRERLARLRDWVIAAEDARRVAGRPLGTEIKGRLTVAAAGGPFLLVGRADRIDATADGLAIYDYKAGGAPSQKQVEQYAKQMPLLAAIAGAGGFEEIDPAPVAALTYVVLAGDADKAKETTVEAGGDVAADLARLIGRFDAPDQPYTARAAPQWLSWESDYEHLSRFGEWSDRAPGEGI